MPYEIKHVSKNKFQVINRLTGKIHSKGTTLDKAEKQVRLVKKNNLTNYKKHDPKIHGNWTCLYLLATLT